jgi:hypothetical protein
MSDYLRRYTNLPALLYVLKRRKITLLDPQTWDDKNDSHFLSLYKEKKKLKTVLALCFADASETYHHWRVFADGSSGVCIRFKRKELLRAIAKQPGVRRRSVEYLALTDIKSKKPQLKDLPFLKRAPYVDEGEFRIIFESETDNRAFLDIEIPLSCIERITLSPWIHSALADDVKATIKGIDGCDKLSIVRSTLISNERWKKIGEEAS